MTAIFKHMGGSPMTEKAIRYDDWSALTKGHVELRQGGTPVTCGVVDLAMPGGNALWVRDDKTGERRYYAKSDGYSAWISPSDLQPRPAPDSNFNQ